MGAGVILVEAREANTQRFDLIVLRRLGWGKLHSASCIRGMMSVGLRSRSFGCVTVNALPVEP